MSIFIRSMTLDDHYLHIPTECPDCGSVEEFWVHKNDRGLVTGWTCTGCGGDSLDHARKSNVKL